ncbi:conserved hypothetical protein [Heliomicrobium modesticaldum Ice1]|uniref:DUF4397 domain-containing protein n=1 Tax=Heliobacterium modesticaldum (strain ATCC 51547 / Ice1) TaxID=498761 RepID=B0TGD2_HELMI|nr:DUF4397 domain-containing protein [Heliomicrobium modesticaldum]ABZ84628.1 conserved hypothetical protein [Heliomicrobium modesticaldum Ice1]
MYDAPFQSPHDGFSASVDGRSYLRVLHAAPNAPPVDIYANNVLIIRRLPYSRFTQYFPVLPGRYRIEVFPTGTRTTPVIVAVVDIPDRAIITAAAVGVLPNLSLLPIADPRLPRRPDTVYIRFAHLSPDAPAVDVTLPNGTVLFRNVSFRQVTDYIPVPPGTYTLQVRPAGSTQVVLTVPNVRLLPNRFLTVYAVGLAGGRPPLRALIPLDGNTYLPLTSFPTPTP